MNQATPTTPTGILHLEKCLLARLFQRAMNAGTTDRNELVNLVTEQYTGITRPLQGRALPTYHDNQLHITRWGVLWDDVGDKGVIHPEHIMLDISVLRPDLPGRGVPSIPQARFLGVYELVTYYMQHLGSTGHYVITAINADDNTIDQVMLGDPSALAEFQAGMEKVYDGSEHAFEMALAFNNNFYNAE